MIVYPKTSKKASSKRWIFRRCVELAHQTIYAALCQLMKIYCGTHV